MFNPLLDLDKEKDQYYGFYRGIVVNNNDPKKAGRIQVKVFPMFKDVQDEHLPWAIPADPSFGGGANIGGANIPVKDSHVFVFFENGDFRFPVYFAGAPAIQNDSPDIPTLSREDDGTVSKINQNASKGVSTAFGGAWDEPDSAYAAQYPKNRVYRSESGILVEIDDTDGNTRIHIYHPSGTRTEIDDTGNKVEHVVATKTTVIVGDDNIEVKGNHNETVGSNHGIKIGTDGRVSVGSNYRIETGSTCVLSVGSNCTINASGDVVISAGGNVTITGSAISLN